MNISDVTAHDLGRSVRYATGHTTLEGVLDSYDETLLYVRFSGGTYKMQFLDPKSKTMKPSIGSAVMDSAVPVPTDPANVEFV